jgi:hypothetical protein
MGCQLAYFAFYISILRLELPRWEKLDWMFNVTCTIERSFCKCNVPYYTCLYLYRALHRDI